MSMSVHVRPWTGLSMLTSDKAREGRQKYDEAAVAMFDGVDEAGGLIPSVA